MRPTAHSGPTFHAMSWNVAGLRALLKKVSTSTLNPKSMNPKPSALSWNVPNLEMLFKKADASTLSPKAMGPKP